LKWPFFHFQIIPSRDDLINLNTLDMKTFTQARNSLFQLLTVLVFLFYFGENLIAQPPDEEDPEALCIPSITVSLGSDGMADILPEMIDAGSSGGCMDDDPNFNLLPGAINEELFFVVIPGTVNCDDIGGIVLVDLQVTDQCGNTATCTSEVTVIDDAPPTPLCISGLAVILPPSGEERFGQVIWRMHLKIIARPWPTLTFPFPPM
jgi:hypothetical protein